MSDQERFPYGLKTDLIRELRANAGVSIASTLRVDTVAEKTSAAGVTLDGVTLKDGAVICTANVGAKNGATVSAVEYGDGILHQTVLTLTATPITVRDTEQGGGVKIYDFPEGRIYVVGATGSVTLTTTSVLADTLNASSSVRWGVGTVTQANATLATTEQDLLPVTTATSSATINVANSATTAALASPAVFDGTSTAKDAFFNISVPTGTDIDGNATVTVTGTVKLTWIFLGDL